MKFEDVREKVLEKLNSAEFRSSVGEELMLANGFVNQSLASAEGEIVIGGSVLPMVMAIGKNTGKVHFFAFKALGIK